MEREQIVEGLARLDCTSCKKHGVYYHCAKDGNMFCKECWIEHLKVHPEGYHLEAIIPNSTNKE